MASIKLESWNWKLKVMYAYVHSKWILTISSIMGHLHTECPERNRFCRIFAMFVYPTV